jgi:hypothetical protein
MWLRLALLLALLLRLAGQARAGSIVLAWECTPPASCQVPYEMVSVRTWEGVTSHTTGSLPPLEDAACRKEAASTYTAAQTWCALFPCTEPGAYQLVRVGTDTAISENGLAFGMRAGTTCQMVSSDEALLTPARPRFASPSPAPAAPDETPTPAPAPSAPAPDVTMTIALPETMDEDAMEGLVKQLAALDAAFRKLDEHYQAQLAAVRATYEAAMKEAEQLTAARDYTRAQEAYTTAQERQHEIYTLTVAHWEAIYQAWQQVLPGFDLASHQ